MPRPIRHHTEHLTEEARLQKLDGFLYRIEVNPLGECSCCLSLWPDKIAGGARRRIQEIKRIQELAKVNSRPLTACLSTPASAQALRLRFSYQGRFL